MQAVKTAVYTFYNIENPRDVSGRRQLNLSGEKIILLAGVN